jgi:hypothetical protein
VNGKHLTNVSEKNIFGLARPVRDTIYLL